MKVIMCPSWRSQVDHWLLQSTSTNENVWIILSDQSEARMLTILKLLCPDTLTTTALHQHQVNGPEWKRNYDLRMFPKNILSWNISKLIVLTNTNIHISKFISLISEILLYQQYPLKKYTWKIWWSKLVPTKSSTLQYIKWISNYLLFSYYKQYLVHRAKCMI